MWAPEIEWMSYRRRLPTVWNEGAGAKAVTAIGRAPMLYHVSCMSGRPQEPRTSGEASGNMAMEFGDAHICINGVPGSVWH